MEKAYTFSSQFLSMQWIVISNQEILLLLVHASIIMQSYLRTIRKFLRLGVWF